MSNSPLPPTTDEELTDWITGALDGASTRQRLWRRRLLGGKSMTEAVADLPDYKVVSTRILMRELSIASKVIVRSGGGRSRWLRGVIGLYLIDHARIDPQAIPELAADAEWLRGRS